MEFVKGFRDLAVYKLARNLSKEIFEISKQFPRERNVFTDRSDQEIIAVRWSANSRSLGKKKI